MDLERRLSEGPLRVSSLWSQERTDKLPQRLLARRRRQALVRGVAALAATAALAAGAWLWIPRGAEPRAAAPIASVAAPKPLERERELALSDGSRVSLLAADSRVEVLQQTPVLVRAQLSAGSARFDVRHDPARVFEVESGAVTVRVLGTAFSLVRDGAFTKVRVERGAVRVQWAGGEALLAAGQAGTYPPVVAPRASAEPLGELASNVAEEANGWRKLAGRGAYGEAFKLIGAASGKAVRDEPSDLMLAADVARNSRHPAEATRYLSRVADGFPRDKRAPLAAFTLGRVLLEDLGQPARAADAFKRAQQLAPRGPLASDALAREVDAAQRAGQADRARRLAARYLELYPTGPQAQRLRKL